MDLITIPRIITRRYIQAHPDWLFVYSADYFRKGALGQMWECHGEPNALPITVVIKLCPSSRIYMQDGNDECWTYLSNDIAEIGVHLKPVVIPLRKIGEGISRMPEMAPKLFKQMTDYLNSIKYKNLKIDYYAN